MNKLSVILLGAVLAFCGTSSGQNQNQNRTDRKSVLSSNGTIQNDLDEVLGSGEAETKRGHILFFFPVITKSAKITFMPVAERLAQRGHQVRFNSPFYNL